MWLPTAHDGSLSQLKARGPPAAAQFPNHENSNERNADWGELATKASSNSCVCATDAYFGQAALDVLELKHTLGVYVVWLTSSQLILVLLWM